MEQIPHLIRRTRVEEITGLSKSEVYRRIKAGTFPVPVSVDDTGRSTRWVLAEVVAWTQERINQRTAGARGNKPESRDQGGRFRGPHVEARGA